jgi:hypothetical protein
MPMAALHPRGHLLDRLLRSQQDRREHEQGERDATRRGGETAGQDHDDRVGEHAREDGREPGEHLGAEPYDLRGPRVGSELGDEDRRQDPERHADRRRDRDHHQRADEGVAEAAPGRERGRRRSRNAAIPSTFPPRVTRIQHREERDEREDRHPAREPLIAQLEQRARTSQRARQVR